MYEIIQTLALRPAENSWEAELRYLAARYVPMSDADVFHHASVALEKVDGDVLESADLLFRHCLPVALFAAREWAWKFGGWRHSLDAAITVVRQNLPRLVLTMTGKRAGEKTARGWNPSLACVRLHGWMRMSLQVELPKALMSLKQAVDSGFVEDCSWARKTNTAMQEQFGNNALWWPEFWLPRDTSPKSTLPVHTGRRNVLPKKGKAPAYLDTQDVLTEYHSEAGDLAVFTEHRRYRAGSRPGVQGGRYTQKWVAAQPTQLKTRPAKDVRTQTGLTSSLFDLRVRRDRELSGSLSERWLRAAAREEYQSAVPEAALKAELAAWEHLTGKTVREFRPVMLRGYCASEQENFQNAQLRAFKKTLNRVSRRFTALAKPGWAGSLLSGTVADSLDLKIGDDNRSTVIDVTQVQGDATHTAEGRFDHLEAVSAGVGTRYRAPLIPGDRAALAEQLFGLPTPLVNAALHSDVPALLRAHRKALKERAIRDRWVRVCDQAGLSEDEGRSVAVAALTSAGGRFAERLTEQHKTGLKTFQARFRAGLGSLRGYAGPREHLPVFMLVAEYRRYGRYTGEAELAWNETCQAQNVTPRTAAELIRRLPVNAERRQAPRSSRQRAPVANREFTRWVQRHGEGQVNLIDDLALVVGQKVSALRAEERHAANDLLRLSGRQTLSRVRASRVGREFVIQEALAASVLGDNGLSAWRETLEASQERLTTTLEQLEKATNSGFLLLVAAAELEAEFAVQEAQALLIGEDWISAALNYAN